MEAIQVQTQTQEPNRCNIIEVNRNPKYKKTDRKIKLRQEIREPVQPIKLKEDLQIAKEYLLNKQGRDTTQLRDYALFCVGINLSRRISDLLKLTIKDFLNSNGTFKNSFEMITGKKQKQETVIISQNTKEVLEQYFKANPQLLLDRNNHLFPSREKNSMTRQTAFNIIKEVESVINKTKNDTNDNIHIATHSMRKTKAYSYIQNHKNDEYAIDKVSHALGHDDKKTTMKYLGLDRKELEDFYEEEV